MQSNRVKMRRVAQEAGVSIATVSRVINDSPSVAKPTRERILQAIQQLGYAPNPLAKALNAGRNKTVGAVIPTVDHAIFATFLEAVEEGLGNRGYSLVIATSDYDPEIELRRTKSLLEMGAQAIILSGGDHLPELNDLTTRFGVPLVLTSLYDQGANHPTIGYDNRQMARMAVEHLTSLGHSDIALIHGPLTYNDRTQLRIQGARDAASTIRLVESELSEKGGVDATKEMLTWRRFPSAILCLSDVIALGVMFELYRAGRRIPDDVSLMGFDNLAWSEHTFPSLSCIDLPVHEMGLAAADGICNRLDDGVEIAPKLLNGKLMIRDSTAPPQS